MVLKANPNIRTAPLRIKPKPFQRSCRRKLKDSNIIFFHTIQQEDVLYHLLPF